MIAQLVRAEVLYTSGPRFKSWSPYHDSVVELAYTTDLKSVDHIGLAGSSPATVTIHASVAQLVEHSAFNRIVVGSNPTEGTSYKPRSFYYERSTTKGSSSAR